MRRWLLALLVTATMLAMSTGSVAARGPQPGNLDDPDDPNDWTCFFVEGLGVHCAPPGVGWAPPVERATPLLYWFDSTIEDVDATDLTFSGTELLVSHDQYNDQPCPQEGLDVWHDLGIARACHHNRIDGDLVID
jgi:hypothetical protein